MERRVCTLETQATQETHAIRLERRVCKLGDADDALVLALALPPALRLSSSPLLGPRGLVVDRHSYHILSYSAAFSENFVLAAEFGADLGCFVSCT